MGWLKIVRDENEERESCALFFLLFFFFLLSLYLLVTWKAGRYFMFILSSLLLDYHSTHYLFYFILVSSFFLISISILWFFKKIINRSKIIQIYKIARNWPNCIKKSFFFIFENMLGGNNTSYDFVEPWLFCFLVLTITW